MSKSKGAHSSLRNFNPSRLTLARHRRGLTKLELAERIGVDRRSATAYESGETLPSLETLERIEQELGFPRAFFFEDDVDELTPDAVSFRSMSKMTAAQRYMALAEGRLTLALSQWIERRFELPLADLPNLSTEPSPEEAALTLRQHWGLGEQPVKNMIHLLESQGVRVFSLSVKSREVDAFSTWKDATPFVFLNTEKSAEHSRFDAAHELGHLTMHRHAAPHGREAEDQANAFASAFLMPRRSVLANAPKFAILPTLIELKKTWTVSVSALNHRLHTLGVISDWHYRGLCIEIAKRGYRTSEPSPAPRENSQLLSKVFSVLRSEGVGKAQIARELRLYEEDLDALVFGLTMTRLRGGTLEPPPARATSRPDLRVVSD
ncbi:MAG: XRE family transcriptional regulator [Chloroflexota bacterium]|nr:XRE family transcriptional regulator [Chloroflexota bacterium]